MNRCQPSPLPLRPRRATLWLAALCAAAALTGAPAAAQGTVQGSMGGMRNFPDAALRGSLVITAASEAEINGRTVRMAPGMRLFSPQNTLVMMHTVLGQQLGWRLALGAAQQRFQGLGGPLFGIGELFLQAAGEVLATEVVRVRDALPTQRFEFLTALGDQLVFVDGGGIGSFAHGSAGIV